VHRFDAPVWQRGAWQHVVHGGRLGWWWVVGPNWYPFNAPVYPYPGLYTPYDRPFGWWYWCDPYQEYYPYVTTCPTPWESVMPRIDAGNAGCVTVRLGCEPLQTFCYL